MNRHAVPWTRRIAFGAMFTFFGSVGLLRLGQKLARLGTAPWAKGEWNDRLPGPAQQFTALRDVPRAAAKPFHKLWREQERDRG